jgi:MATE family multidrug resistance protein
MTTPTPSITERESPLRQSRSPAQVDSRPRPERSPELRGGLREVFVLAYPVILTQISITTMHVVDSAMVGSLGATELAAVGLGGVWVWTAVCFFIGTATSVQTFVSQSDGAGQQTRCGAWVWQGIYAVVPMTALAAVALYFGAGHLLSWIGPSPEVQPLAVSYVSARALGSVGLCAAVALNSFFRGIGDTKTPLYATITANVVNAVLDYGLIFGHLGLPALGVTGAGAATAVAEWVNLLALLVAVRRPGVVRRYATQWRAPRPRDVRRLLRTGLPIGGQWCLEMISFAVFLSLVARMGDVPMAASQAFVALLGLSFMQAIGLSIAVATLVGQYIGAGDPASVERSFRSGLELAAILAGVIALLFAAVPGLLLEIFTDDPEVLRLGRPLLVVGALFQFFDAFGIVADGALRGAGDTRWPFGVRFVLSWGVFVPLAYVLGVWLDGGLTWAWIGGTFYVALLSAALLLRFRSGAWRQIRI